MVVEDLFRRRIPVILVHRSGSRFIAASYVRLFVVCVLLIANG